MFSLKKSELLIESCWLLAGNIILAIGVAWFILPNDVLTGGLAGCRNCHRTYFSYYSRNCN